MLYDSPLCQCVGFLLGLWCSSSIWNLLSRHPTQFSVLYSLRLEISYPEALSHHSHLLYLQCGALYKNPVPVVLTVVSLGNRGASALTHNSTHLYLVIHLPSGRADLAEWT